MAVRPYQNNFTSGELSPRMHARSDFPKYQNGLATLENMYAVPQGGVKNRPGTRFVAEVKDSTKLTRLVPFQFSTTQAYVIEFGNQYLRFHKDGGVITQTALNITAATAANPVVITSALHGYSNGDRVIITGVGGMVQLNNREFAVANVTANTFELSGINGTAFTAYTSGGTVAKIVEVTSPYLEAHLFALKYAQTADTLYIVHPSYAPRVLTRTSHTAWTLNTVAFTDGPFLEENTDEAVTVTVTGGQLVTNGTFNTNITGWTDASTAPGAIAWNAGQFMDLTAGGGGERAAARQSITTVSGIVYTLTFTVGVGALLLRVGTSAGGTQLINDVSFGAGAQSTTFTAASATTWLEWGHTAAGVTRTLDTVSIIKPLHTGAAVTMTASSNLWNANHVGAFWRIADPSGAIETAAEWTAATAVTIGDRRVSNNALYEATTTGTTGTRAPVHERGTVTDGVVNWAFINKGWGYVDITAYTSATEVDGTVRRYLPSTASSGTFRWAEGAWSPDNGYPGAITFDAGQRLVLGGTTNNPDRFWGSVISEFTNFEEGTDDDDSYSFRIASTQVNVIRWLTAMRSLLAGTAGGEYNIVGGNDSPVSPTNILVREQSARGSVNLAPVKVGNSVIFVARGGRQIYDLKYDFASDEFRGTDLAILSEHLTEGGIDQADYQQTPDSVVWLVRGDGTLLSLTYLPEQDVFAWARHVTDGEFESVACIPSTDGTIDEVWVVVKRTINSATKRYVEYFDADVNSDCTLSYSGASSTSITGLFHLNGKTVEVESNGIIYDDEVVASSNFGITLDTAVAAANIGLDFTPTLTTLEPVATDNRGVVRNKFGGWRVIELSILSTGEGLTLTIDGDDVTEEFRDSSMLQDTAVPLQTGERRLTALGINRSKTLTVKQVNPRPIHIRALYGELELED